MFYGISLHQNILAFFVLLSLIYLEDPPFSPKDMLRAMVRMNPQLNELMEQRPEIARMLEDPELLQQSLRNLG